jgi:hypothetical protein
MKRKALIAALALALMLSIAPMSVGAAPAYTASWQVAITYLNVGSAPAEISFNFYSQENATAIPVPAPGGQLPKNAGASLAIGSVSQLGSGSFKGSAVLNSNQPVVATIVQFSQVADDPKNRPVSNGFSSADASPTQLIATVLKDRFGYRTVFSVQNADTVPADITLKVYAVGNTNPVVNQTFRNLPAGAAKYFDVGQGPLAGLPANFNGSAIVTSKKAGTTNDGLIVITANELETAGFGSSAFEGAPQGGAKVYMPSAFCDNSGVAGGIGPFNSSYAVQNASLTGSVTFRVVYKDERAGQPDRIDGPYSLTPGGKKSIISCASNNRGGVLPNGFKGSAVIERTGGTGTLLAVGKIQGNNNTTAFLGARDGSGSAKVVLPYVRWSPDSTFNTGQRQRVSMAIQNIGTTTATNVRVQYVDKDGTLKGTHVLGNIAPTAKLASNPSQAPGALDSLGRFGEYGPSVLGTAFGGGAIVLADSGQLAVVARVQTGNLGGEDYNGSNAP